MGELSALNWQSCSGGLPVKRKINNTVYIIHFRINTANLEIFPVWNVNYCIHIYFRAGDRNSWVEEIYTKWQ